MSEILAQYEGLIVKEAAAAAALDAAKKAVVQAEATLEGIRVERVRLRERLTASLAGAVGSEAAREPLLSLGPDAGIAPRVRALFEKHPERAFGIPEICRVLGVEPDNKTVRSALNHLKGKGQIEPVPGGKAGVYRAVRTEGGPM